MTCAEKVAELKPNVLLIVLDCVRADRMSCYGYGKDTTPNLRSLAKESTTFDAAISAAPWTLPSHASMFTGLYPSEHGAVTWDSALRKDVRTLSQILSGVGYHTAAVCHNDAWINARTVLAEGFQSFHGSYAIDTSSIMGRYADSRMKNLPALGTLAAFYNSFILRKEKAALSIALIKSILRESRSTNIPVFIFVNLINAHYPYVHGLPNQSLKAFLEETRENWLRTITRYKSRGTVARVDPRTVMNRKWKQLATRAEFTPSEFRGFGALYDTVISYLDRQLGDLLSFMRTENILDQTLLMITADHGENLGDHGLIDHELSVHESLIRVPLVARYPGVFPAKRRIAQPVETRRIFHTILDISGARSSEDTRTKSLVNTLERQESGSYAFGEYYPSQGLLSRLAMYSSAISPEDRNFRRFVRDVDFKLVKYGNGQEELYSLREGEIQVNRDQYSEVYHRLKGEIEAWEKRLEISKVSDASEAPTFSDKEQKMLEERLRALGYY
jgi:arylsulfatase A-like enzyme